MKHRRPASAWPHGRPTIVCPACMGTGADPVLVRLYLKSRAPAMMWRG